MAVALVPTLVDSVVQGLAKRARMGAAIIVGDGPDRPDLVVLDPEYGPIAMEIEPDGTQPADRAPIIRLNRKVEDIRMSVEGAGSLRFHRLVLLGRHVGKIATGTASSATALGLGDIASDLWLTKLPPRPLESKRIEAIRRELAPSLIFTLQSRRGACDEGAQERARLRIRLDEEQAAVARAPTGDVLVLSGPPGSGKTLVLAGRARLLASQHPDWTVVVLCYNRALVPYLRRLTVGHPNIEVTTFGKFAHGLGYRIALDNDVQAEHDVERARRLGIAEVVDALLIDEVQDFSPAWINFALATLRPSRGGATIAGDGAQALYRDHNPASALAGRRVETMTLTRPYRSTQQILRVSTAMFPDLVVEAIADAPEGEPVDLVWAANWDEQAKAVAWEIRALLDSGERQPADIGVLVTQRSATVKRLESALTAAGIAHQVVGRDNVGAFDPDAPLVKVMTVHSAKGHEFGVVFLFGLEALRFPADDANPDFVRRARVGLVGTTRARDQLLITYTRDNPYLDRLRRCGDDVRSWTWPDDYEV